MKVAVVTLKNKVGQRYCRNFLLCESNIHNDVKNMVFSVFGVDGWSKPNKSGDSVIDIQLSDDIGYLFGASGNELVEFTLTGECNEV